VPRGRALLWTTDQVALGVHARADAPPEALARKLLLRTLSDLAAAGAQPWAVLWTIAAPRQRPLAYLRRLARAFLAEARRHRVAVVGGDCTTARALVLTCSALGLEARRGTPGRSGARPGDVLLVTGRLGDAVRSGRHLRPVPRLAEGRLLAATHRAHAMMDLSDGLARDLPRLLERSRVGAAVRLESLPLAAGLSGSQRAFASAIGEGEDYELLAALAPADARRALADARLRRCGIHAIGRITAARGLLWLKDGVAVPAPAAGFSHRWRGSRT